MGKFSDIPVNSLFKANGVTYKKIDDLYYIDITEPDLERMSSPLFEQTIGEKVVLAGTVDTTAKYITDPNTRVVSLNPHYIENAAAVAMERIYDAFGVQGLLDGVSKDDYSQIADRLIALKAKAKAKPAKKAVKTVAKKSAPKKKSSGRK